MDALETIMDEYSALRGSSIELGGTPMTHITHLVNIGEDYTIGYFPMYKEGDTSIIPRNTVDFKTGERGITCTDCLDDRESHTLTCGCGVPPGPVVGPRLLGHRPVA